MGVNSNSISFLFAGDFAPCRGFERIALGRGKEIFGDLQVDIAEADLSFLNLETPLCINGKPIKKSGPNIRAHPDCIHAILDAGFNAVGLANNHVLDFGVEGLKETMAACRGVGLPTCGAGKNLKEAQVPLILERKMVKVAFIAVAEHEFSIAGTAAMPGSAPLDPIDNTTQIEDAVKKADFVFVIVHGGNEYFPYPRPGLRKICRFFIDRGADAVLCHHVHVPGAYEFFKGKPIVYSLGNLIFDTSKPPISWDKGYTVNLDYHVKTKALTKFEILPYSQSVVQGGIKKIQGHKKIMFLEKIAEYNRVLGDNFAYMRAWDEFCKKEKNMLLLKNYSPFNFRGMRKISEIFNPELFLMPTNASKQVKLNMIRCQSHLELLQRVLGYNNRNR